MNERRKKFIEEYILSGNASEAARRAGYSARSAYSTGERLLRNAEVKAAIDERLGDLRSEKILAEKDLLEFLSQVVKGEVKDEQLMTRLIGKGNSVIERHEFRASVKDRLRACEMLAKIFGMFNREESQDSELKKYIEALEAISSEDTV